VPTEELVIEQRVSGYEWVAEGVLAAGVVVVAALLGLLSDHVVAPYARATFPTSTEEIVGISPVITAVILLAVLFLPVLALWAAKQKDYDEADFYASGRNTRGDRVMGAALGGSRTVSLRGYYLDGVVDGALVFRTGTIVCGLALAAMTIAGLVTR
jgi:hypothetical protein